MTHIEDQGPALGAAYQEGKRRGFSSTGCPYHSLHRPDLRTAWFDGFGDARESTKRP